MSALTAPVTLTLEELWLLQSVIRHEVAQQETWKFPPASVQFNDQVAEAILACTESSLEEFTLALTRGDLLAIDAVVPQAAKNAAGIAIGKSVLLKSFVARRYLSGDWPVVVEEPAPLSADDFAARLDKWKTRRRRKGV